jgi:hypothetical protein
MSIRYVLRKPRFPVIVILGERVFRAISSAALQKLLRHELKADADIRILDTDWKWFTVIVGEISAIAPSFADFQAPTKEALIALVHNRANRVEADPTYQRRSLSSRSREEIFQELIGVLPAG